MSDDKVTLQEVAPATVSQGTAWRIVIGKFVVDFIETLSVVLPVTLLFVPTSTEDVKKLVIILGTPVGAALVSAGRRAWPAIRKWLSPGGPDA